MDYDKLWKWFGIVLSIFAITGVFSLMSLPANTSGSEIAGQILFTVICAGGSLYIQFFKKKRS